MMFFSAKKIAYFLRKRQNYVKHKYHDTMIVV